MKLLPKLALSTTLLGSVGCVSNLENIVNEKPARQNIVMPKEAPQTLYVNTNKEHYIIEKSREEGEKDLYGLTLTSELEEAWVFVEYLDGRGMWYEHGIEIEGEKEKLCLDEKPLIEIVKDKDDIKRLSLYHFHLVDMDSDYDHSQTPLLDDFVGFFTVLSKLNNHDEKLADKADIKIIVSTGAYTIKFDNEVFHDEGARKELVKIIYGIFTTRLVSVTDEYDEFNYSQSNRINFSEVNKKFAEKFDSELMRFSFEPRKVY